MTTKDSTGDKLVASIRKTKSGAGTSSKTARKKVVKKSAKRSSKQATPGKDTKLTSSSKKQLVDMFQSGRRVWPD